MVVQQNKIGYLDRTMLFRFITAPAVNIQKIICENRKEKICFSEKHIDVAYHSPAYRCCEGNFAVRLDMLATSQMPLHTGPAETIF